MDSVTLAYKRVGPDRAVGSVISCSDNPPSTTTKSFDGIEWEAMMLLFAEALKKAPDAAGVIQRTDREGLKPYIIGTMELERFRTDPMGAINAMTFHVAKTARPEPVAENVMKPLPASISALVDVFGDVLWLHAESSALNDGYLVECPVSASMVPLLGNHINLPDGQLLLGSESLYLKNGWFGVSAFELLLKGFSKYYVPRAWNESGPWIDWDELDKKLKDFDQERERAS